MSETLDKIKKAIEEKEIQSHIAKGAMAGIMVTGAGIEKVAGLGKKIVDAAKKLVTFEININEDGTTNFNKDEIASKIKTKAIIHINAKKINPETIATCKKIVSEMKNPLQKLDFDMNIPDGYADNKQVKLLTELNNHIQANTQNRPLWTRLLGERASVCADNKKWSFKQVLNANRTMNRVIEKINSHTVNGQPLSPYEKYLAAYGWVSSSVYKSENVTDKQKIDIGIDFKNQKLNNIANIVAKGVVGITKALMQPVRSELSRDPMKVLQDKEREPMVATEHDSIVCVGYARLLEHLCHGLGIKCVEQHCQVVEPGKMPGNHANNCVYLNDPKYNINGIFYSDPTWDCRGKNETITEYGLHAIPFSKLDKLQHMKIERLMFLSMLDGTPPREYPLESNEYHNKKQKMEKFISSFDPDVLQRVSRPTEIPWQATQGALINALTCQLGQANNLENMDMALAESMWSDASRFEFGKTADSKAKDSTFIRIDAALGELARQKRHLLSRPLANSI